MNESGWLAQQMQAAPENWVALISMGTLGVFFFSNRSSHHRLLRARLVRYRQRRGGSSEPPQYCLFNRSIFALRSCGKWNVIYAVAYFRRDLNTVRASCGEMIYWKGSIALLIVGPGWRSERATLLKFAIDRHNVCGWNWNNLTTFGNCSANSAEISAKLFLSFLYVLYLPVKHYLAKKRHRLWLFSSKTRPKFASKQANFVGHYSFITLPALQILAIH